MKIYDSLSETKKAVSKSSKPLKLFVCGPTVYDYPHIGNARTYVAFDIIVRYLRSKGIKIEYLQNITDIDDKIIEKAKKEKTDWKEIAKKFEKIYNENEKELKIISVSQYAKATSYIKEIVSQVKRLMEKGFAYEIKKDGIYFNVSKFKDYGKLSKRKKEDAQDGVSRIDESVNKKNKADFCLWKYSKKNEPSWKTTIGEGRPGWHIEDTAITESIFGPQYDIHGGAVDLKFPHHEAEIAQQESVSGKKPLVKIWMHTGFLLVEGQKMSKSLKNFVTIKDFLEKYPSDVFRYIVFSHHYRSPIDYSDNLAIQAKNTINNLAHLVLKLNVITRKSQTSEKIKKAVDLAYKNFDSAMSDDFNSPLALASLFELVNLSEKQFPLLNESEAQLIQKCIVSLFSQIGIEFQTSQKIPAKITEMARKRQALRSNKQFIQSDALRDEINSLGYSVEDTAFGPMVYKN